MKRKPRIFKGTRQNGKTGWLIKLPGYGFQPTTFIGPFESQPAALQHLAKFRMFSAAAATTSAKAYAPEASDWRRGGHALYPLRIIS